MGQKHNDFFFLFIFIIPQMKLLSVTCFFFCPTFQERPFALWIRPYVQLQGGEGKLSAEILQRAGPASSLCSPHWKQKVQSPCPGGLCGNPAKQGTKKKSLLWVSHMCLLFLLRFWFVVFVFCCLGWFVFCCCLFVKKAIIIRHFMRAQTDPLFDFLLRHQLR